MIENLKRLAKEVAGRGLFIAKRQRKILSGKAIVVAFHTISERQGKGSINVSPALFRDYCEFFKKYFDVVPLTSLLDLIDAGKDTSGKLVITFDDGYRDNYTNAAPVLESFGLPATFFVTTDFVGSTTIPWWDRESGVNSEWMSWDEVVDLDRRGFDIGAHTRSHPNLRFSSEEAAREEIAGSKAEIERRLGHPIAHFAYPYGRRGDTSTAVRALVKEAGFRCCVSCYGGLVGTNTDSMDMPRMPINDWFGSPYQFGLDALRDVSAAGGEYADVAPAGERVLVVSYHLYPDPAVGARRPSELMRFLAGKGYEVEGLSGCLRKGEPADPKLRALLNEFRILRVPQPPSITDWLWKHIKSAWAVVSRRFTTNMHQVPAAGADLPGGGGTRESHRDWLRRQYNALYSLYDAHKCWALLSVMRLSLSWGRRYNVVISSGPPSASHLVGCIGAKRHRARYVMDFRDPWVGNSHVSPASSSRLRNWFETHAERACIRRAELVVVTTPGIQRMLANRYPNQARKIHVIYNGYDGEPRPVSVNPHGKMNLLYAGTLYMNRNPFPILEALKRFVEGPCIERSKVAFTFVGHCETWNGLSLREWVVGNEMTDVIRVFPPVSQREIEDLTDGASILVNLAQGQPDQIPAKTFEYLASGKPMLLVSEAASSTAQMVNGISSVVSVTPSDTSATLVDTFAQLYQLSTSKSGSSRATDPYLARFSRRTQNQELLRLLQQADIR